MSEQGKKRQRIYDLLYVKTEPNFLCLPYTKQRKIFFFTDKELFKEKWDGALNRKRKEGFLTILSTAMKKEPTTSIRKHANELRANEKTENNN